MPKIISDVPEYLVVGIQQLVQEERYSSIDSFVRLAIENQLALEKVDSTRGKLSAPVPASASPRYSFSTGKIVQVVQPPTFEDLNISGAESERDLWLWGQVNRVLPLKFCLRALVRSLPADANVIEYWNLSRHLCAEAREFGSMLGQKDRQLAKTRGEGLSAAFPTGSDVDKASERFRNLFLGALRSDGKPSGALPQLKFIALVKDGDAIGVGITRAGLQFAEIESPVLDRGDFASALSEEEATYYLGHILATVPGEVQAFKMILSAISTGKTRREDLNAAIANLYRKWSEPLVNTQRTGAMSRMFELGLISKVKSGVTVQYGMTARGEEFLARGSSPLLGESSHENGSA